MNVAAKATLGWQVEVRQTLRVAGVTLAKLIRLCVADPAMRMVSLTTEVEGPRPLAGVRRGAPH